MVYFNLNYKRIVPASHHNCIICYFYYRKSILNDDSIKKYINLVVFLRSQKALQLPLYQLKIYVVIKNLFVSTGYL